MFCILRVTDIMILKATSFETWLDVALDGFNGGGSALSSSHGNRRRFDALALRDEISQGGFCFVDKRRI